MTSGDFASALSTGSLYVSILSICEGERFLQYELNLTLLRVVGRSSSFHLRCVLFLIKICMKICQ